MSKIKFPCGHKGKGKFCHRCEQESRKKELDRVLVNDNKNYPQDDWSLPVADLDYISDSFEMIKYLRSRPRKREDGSIPTPLEDCAYFFSHALRGYYDCMFDGMKTIAGHVIYRLADMVPEELRKSFMVYPSGFDEYKGSITDEKGMTWYSLEDFRKDWFKAHDGNIPEMINLFPEAYCNKFKGEIKGLLG